MILGIGANSKLCKDRWGSVVLLTILLLCLCANSWGACRDGGTHSCNYFSNPGGSCSYSYSCCDNPNNTCTATVGGNPNNTTIVTSCSFNYCYYGWPANGGTCSFLLCDTQAEADSANCANNPSAEGCKEEDVPEACEEQYSSCMNAGGVWKKVGTSGSNCTSVCDLCGSGNAAKFMNRLNSYCCSQPGMAPPDSAAMCYTPSSIPNDMTVSTIVSSRNEVIAGCSPLTTSDGQMIDESAANYKRFCEDGDQYEEQEDTNSPPGSSSSDGGMSSSGEGGGTSDSGTSFGTELEALGGIYGVLDTIRDTLVKRLTPATEEIRDCLYNARLCLAFDSIKVDWSNMPKDSTWLYIDTGLVKYLRPFMDASVALDSNQLKAIRKLDTNILKQLHLDSAMLKNDTATRRAVNSGFEGVLKNDTVTRGAVNRLDTTVVSLDSSLRKGIREGTDNLIDSMDRYLGRVDSSIGAVGSNGTALGDSLGSIHGAINGVVNSLDSSIRSGYGSADTGSGNFPWISQGESQRDSILGGGPGGTGFGGLDFGGDSAWMDSMENIGYICDGDSCCIGDKCEYFESDSMIVDSLRRHAQRLGDSVRALNDVFYRDSVDDIFEEVKDSLRVFNPLHIFDSTLLSELGASIPNSNTCPEHCSTFQVDIPFFFGTQHAVIDWGLCMGRTAFANGNVLSFLRFIIRIIVAVTCITAVMWNATRIRR